jgi:hypothetical protein
MTFGVSRQLLRDAQLGQICPDLADAARAGSRLLDTLSQEAVEDRSIHDARRTPTGPNAFVP